MSMRSFLIFALFALSALAAVTALAQDPRYDRDPGYGNNGYRDAVDCKSIGYNLQQCAVPWRDARIVRQLSDTPCRRGENWGFDRHGLWVDKGCAARFVDASGGPDGGWAPPSGWNHRFHVECSSRGYQYQFCAVDLGRGGRAYLRRQTSNSACIEGRTWGWNRAGIWVDQGCGGVFTIDRRWR
jgi:hypothetical protein